MKTNTKRAQGFTIIELMIAVVVLAILGSIAIPSYLEQVRRSSRAEAQSQLLLAAQFLERTYTITGSYPATPLPTDVEQSPPPPATPKYNIAVLTNPPVNNTYTLTATAVGSMAGDRCGNFILASTGAKGLSGNTSAVDECWRR